MDSNKIKKGLGRGLSSLIGETKVETPKNQLSISDLIPNKYQPRKIFDDDNLNDLTNSIKERGILQPIIVRKSNDDKYKFEIIAGERRWLAAQKAGLHTVPVVITEADDLKSLEFAIVENVQRHDLNPLEEAQGYKRLIDEFNYDQEKVSKFIGKSRSHITNSLRLLTLPIEVIKLIETQKLTAGHAKILVGLENSSFVANKITAQEAIILDLNDFEMPIYSEDRHSEEGVPQKALEFKKIVNDCSGLVISLAEHNGSYTSAFKNIYDWISVIEKIVWSNKPILLMSTSDGARGGQSVLETALPRFSRQSNFDIPHFILPSFYENFSEELGIINQKLDTELDKQILEFKKQVGIALLDSRNN